MIVSLLALAILVGGLATGGVLAGDKVRGKNGEGLVAQECLSFDEGVCPYGDYNPEK